MTIATINMLVGILAGIKLNKILDKKVKATLLRDYLALRKVAKDADEDKNEIIKKFQDDWREELSEVEAFRREDKPVEGHKEYLDAERDANKAISEILAGEADVELTPIKMDAVAELSEDITLEQVAFLQEIGLIED